MSITLEQLNSRLSNREQEPSERETNSREPRKGWRQNKKYRFKPRKSAPRKWLSRKDRDGIIELCLALALKMRRESLKRMITRLGGFCKREDWLAENIEKIVELRNEYAKIKTRIEELKKERKDFKERIGGNYTTDNSPHLAAKTLQVDVVVIYRVLRRYAETGNTMFNGDLKSTDDVDLLGKNRDDDGIRPKRGEPSQQDAAHAATTDSKLEPNAVQPKNKVPDSGSDYYRDSIDESDFLPVPSIKKQKNHKRFIPRQGERLAKYLARKLHKPLLYIRGCLEICRINSERDRGFPVFAASL